MECPSCNLQNPEDALSCNYCATTLQPKKPEHQEIRGELAKRILSEKGNVSGSTIKPNRFCTKCGSEVYSTASFCSNCGFSLIGLVEKKSFGVFSFQSRWLILAMIIALSASEIDTYLTDTHLYLSDAVLGGYIIFVITRNKISINALVGKIPSGYNWWPIALLTLGVLAFSWGSSVVVIYPLAQLDAEVVNELMNPALSSTTYLFIGAVILAPLLEEVIFRGILFTRLTKKWGITRGMILSSLFFGLLHFPINPIGALLLGIVACILYIRTRTLWIPIALHSMNNLVAVIIYFTLENEVMDFSSAEFLAEYTFEGLIALILGAPIVFFILGRWWPARENTIPYEANSETLQDDR